jgi:hypothetical protein
VIIIGLLEGHSVHIVENKNEKAGRTYCYACECLWDKTLGRYHKPRISIGHLEGEPPSFVPNRSFAQVLATDPSLMEKHDRLTIATAVAKYGDGVLTLGAAGPKLPDGPAAVRTARAVFTGPLIVFGGITRRYRIDAILLKAFGEDAARDILSLAWYIASEGAALGNSDAWLERFETPRGCAISSQEITRLFDGMSQDSIMTFYKEWLSSLEKTGDRVLYDLTSISWNGRGIDLAGWGHNRDGDALPQVTYALLCTRSTAMPLFAWPLSGSVSDTRTLQNTLQFLDKLGYRPDCLMMDRGFASQENIGYMLRRGYTFLQALRVNAGWIREIIDAGRRERLRPDSMMKAGDRTYYTSTARCQWVVLRKMTKKGAAEETLVSLCNGARGEQDTTGDEGLEILSRHPCNVHVLFCQDLVGGQWDRFMESLSDERNRLLADEGASARDGLGRYFRIEKKKYARHRTVEFNMESIEQHRDRYAGHTASS